jgi:signal transduction histidine kinase
LLEVRPNVVLPTGSLRAFQRQEGLILEVTVPIGDGHLGSVRLGVGDKRIALDLASVNRSILAGMVLCLLATVCSALLLTYVLNRPIHSLLGTTKLVAKGDFTARAKVYSEDELGRLAVAFNLMTESLAESRQRVLRADRLASIGQFAAGVAHEINNPLDGVMSCLARLERDPSNLAQNMEYLQMIQHALRRVSGVIQRLLEYSATREMNAQPENINAIIDNVVAFIRVMARQNGTRIELDASDVPPVLCDRYHIEQALLNLALNGMAAINESPAREPAGLDRGRLTFSTLTAAMPDGAPCVQIDVADNGAGIPPQNIGKIFDTFFSTKASGKGTGLGLAIVKEIIETHSGKITVESTVGNGTVFHVMLPVSVSGGGETSSKGVLAV